jgi:hypothetical protein
MRDNHKCSLLFVAGVLLMISAPAIVPAQGWMEYSRSDCPKDTAATWRRGYLEGYTQSPSIAQGQTVEFKVSTLAAYIPQGQVTTVQCAMKIYRAVGRTLAGDELMATASNFTATFYPLHDSVGQPIFPGDRNRFPRDYRTGCSWTTATSYQIPSTWPSGFYYAKLFLPGHEQDSVGYIPFVVRAANPGSTSKTLCVIAWNTYQAYNWWGGGSLYYYTGIFGSEDSSAGTPSIPVIRKVSFRRPFGVQWVPWGTPPNCGWLLSANQLGQFDNIYNNPIVRMERFFVSWAYEARDTMEFCVDADVNANANVFLSNYRFVVFPGHSEYWSLPQRQNIEGNPQHTDFKYSGGNVAFFGANNCYWKVDYFPSGTNNPDSMYCDKDWTVRGGRYLWRRQADITTGDTLHEARFIGVEFLGVNDPADNYPNRVKKAEHWVFRGTGLDNDAEFGKGTSELLPLAGAEVDRFIAIRSPSNTQVLADTFIRVLTDWTNEPHIGEVAGDSVISSCTYYEDTTTNSRVFAGGGLGWPGCLFGQDSTIMRTLTTNILDHFSGKKYIGNIYTDLRWSQARLGRDTVEVDGNSYVLSGKTLFVENGMKITIDDSVALFISGELQIPTGATATISGLNNKWGNLVIDSAGTLRVKSGATLNLIAPLYFVLETGSNLILESGATLNIRTVTSVGANVTITVPSGATLQAHSRSQFLFGNNARVVIKGTLIVDGVSDSGNGVTFTRTGTSGTWAGIVFENGGSGELDYANFSYCATGVQISGEGTLSVANCFFSDVSTAVSVGGSAEFTMTNCTIDNADIGVDIVSSDSDLPPLREISNCTISNIGTVAIAVDGYSNLLISGNTIEAQPTTGTGLSFFAASPTVLENHITGTKYGAYCASGSAPVFENELAGGCNLISENDHGVYCDGPSDAILGYIQAGPVQDEGGQNNISGNFAYDVVLRDKSHVLAHNNWEVPDCFAQDGKFRRGAVTVRTSRSEVS